MKRILCVTVIAAVILSLFAGCKNSATPVTDFNYSIKDGEVIITKYLADDDTVVIPKKIEDCPVTTIGVCSFMGKNLTSVSIPDTVTSIWDSAFMACKNLSEVKMSKNVKEISHEAFRNCEALEQIQLPDGLETVGANAFAKCSLKSLKIPKTLSNWGFAAFIDNASLQLLEFEEGLKTIRSSDAFCNCKSLEHLTIPKSVELISESAFLNCPLNLRVTPRPYAMEQLLFIRRIIR
ncbi:MAG: leucine-rich repeat domain-containing protein [Acutalibacteraceae bacterium]